MEKDTKSLFQITEAARACSISRGAEELRPRAGQGSGISVRMITLPAITCCRQLCDGYTTADKYTAMYNF